MMYFGINGRLIGVKCPSVQRVDDGERYQFTTTLEGRRKAQVVPGARRRVWDLTLGDVTTPEQVSVLRGIASGAWGDGPFWFIPAEAPDTNLLEPGVASCDPAAGLASTNAPGGPMRTPDDGWLARSLVRSDAPAGLIHFGGSPGGLTPAPKPGTAVTGAAFVEGVGASAQVAFWDAAGTFLSGVESFVRGTSGRAVRSYVTTTVPSGAVWVSVRAVDASRAAGPSLSWTDKIVEFSDGRGAAQVVVDQVSSGLVYTQPGRTYQNLSFTVTEVG